MTSLADRTITALGDHHGALADLVATLTDDELKKSSGAAEWSVAQVLSHLGSGAELGLVTLRALLAGEPTPDADVNQTVWDRWNAMSPREQADGFLEHDERLVDAYDELTPGQREDVRLQLPYLPAPIDIATFTGMRFNEIALHGWDARVSREPTAGLDDEAAAILAEQHAGGLSFMLGFSAKPETLGRAGVVAVAGYRLEIADRVRLIAAADEPTARFEGPLEAFIRLISGRLKPAYTPDSVVVTGDLSLDDLRKVFPGY